MKYECTEHYGKFHLDPKYWDTEEGKKKLEFFEKNGYVIGNPINVIADKNWKIKLEE